MSLIDRIFNPQVIAPPQANVVSDSKSLADAVRSGAVSPRIFVEPGNYEIDYVFPRPVLLYGAGVGDTTLFARVPITAKWRSRFTDLSIVCDGVGVDATNAAYTIFDRVNFVSPLPMQDHTEFGDGDLSKIQHAGIGVLAPATSDGDNTYKLRFINGCQFDFLDYGIKVERNTRARVNGWRVDDAVFNGCKNAIYGDRIGGWIIFDGNIQLAERGLYISGNGNNVQQLHFERTALNVEIAPNSLYNLVVYNSIQNTRHINSGGGTNKIKPQKYASMKM